MLFKHVDIEGALRRQADRRIEEAMKAGKFDNLAGAGRPLKLDPIPADENARMTWWALRILRQNDVVPDEVRWRKMIDALRGRLSRARHASDVHQLVARINALVYQVNTLGTNALKLPVVAVDLEAQLAELRDRQASVGR
jgi:hypothetical protein